MKDTAKNTILLTLKKYKISKNAKIILGITSGILAVVYFFLLYYENSFSITTMVQQEQEITDATIKTLNHINVFKNCILVVLSMLVSSFISALLIDTKSKNSIVTDLMEKDIFSNPEFYSLLNESHKQNILCQLEKDLYFSGQNEFQNMFSSMRNSILQMSKEQIYYEECDLDIKCVIYDEYIEKNILRTVKVKSYNGTVSLNKYLLMTCAYTDLEDGEAIGINKFLIDDNPIDISEIEKISIDNDSPFNDKSGYNIMKKYVYKNNIDIDSICGKKIQLEYTTRVPLNDKTYSCRMPYACKSFAFEFTLNGNNIDNYRLNTIAFGFIDDGQKTPNRTNDHLKTKVSFNNWIFPYDGVTVTICNNS